MGIQREGGLSVGEATGERDKSIVADHGSPASASFQFEYYTTRRLRSSLEVHSEQFKLVQGNFSRRNRSRLHLKSRL